MSFLPIYRNLNASAELKAILDPSKQVFEDVAPRKTPLPYIVWQTISGQANNHLDAPANFDDTQFQLMVYDTDLQRAYRVRKLARQALENKCWINNPALSNYEPDTKLYARGFDANWILER